MNNNYDKSVKITIYLYNLNLKFKLNKQKNGENIMLPLHILKNAYKFSISDKKTLLKLLPFAIIMIWSWTVGYSIAEVESIFGIFLWLLPMICFILVGNFGLEIVKSGCDLTDEVPNFSIKKLSKGFTIFIIIAFIYSEIISFVLNFDFGPLHLTFDPIFYIFLIIGIALIGRYAYLGDFWKAFKLREIYEDIKTIGIKNMILNIIVISIVQVIAIIPSSIILYIINNFNFDPILLFVIIVLFIIQCVLSSMLFIYFFRTVGLIYSDVIDR